MPSWGADGALVAELSERLSGSVERFRPLAGGASRRTYGFDLVGPSQCSPMVLQVERPGGWSTAAGLLVEAKLLDVVVAHGVEAPRVVTSGERLAGQGPWMVTHHLDGVTDPRAVLHDPSCARGRERLIDDLGVLAGRLASVDPTVLFGPPPSTEPVGELADQLDSFDSTHAAFELGLRWLAGSIPEGGLGRPVLCHGDLRLGNLMVGPTGLVAAMDWELAGWGFPGADLGWTTVRAWRFGAPRPVAGVGGRTELLAAAARAGAVGVDRETLRWWELFGTIRWGLICLVQGCAHLSGLAPSVELAAVGLRVVEAEYDTMLLLTELGGPRRWMDVPRVAPDASSRATGEPDVAAIRDALTGATADGAVDGTGSEARDRDRRIADRLAAALDRWPSGIARLSELDRDLAASCRRVDDPAGWQRVVDAVAARSAQKVRIVSPGYLI